MTVPVPDPYRLEERAQYTMNKKIEATDRIILHPLVEVHKGLFSGLSTSRTIKKINISMTVLPKGIPVRKQDKRPKFGVRLANWV